MAKNKKDEQYKNSPARLYEFVPDNSIDKIGRAHV